MQAIILKQPGQFALRSVEEPGPPPPGEALVRVRKVGVCGTDLHAYKGEQPFFRYPRILGHELAVEVVEVNGPAPGLTVGAHCAVEPYLSCGRCPACRRGKSNCCLNMQVFGVHRDGGMRDFAHLPIPSLHPSPILSDEQLALVEPLAIGAHAVARAQLVSGERVLVIGAGPIGLAVIQFALLAQTQVVVLDVSEQRLRFCHQLWPQVTCLDGRGAPLEALQTLVGDDLPTAVFDATGNAQSMCASFFYTAYAGRLIFVGLFRGDITFHDPDFHQHELTLLSSRNATTADFRHVIAALETKQVDIASWITHRATTATMMDQFPQWFERESGIIKAVIDFSQ
jgi:2-desacetyl-2-hydroxyethyl bacteriochlorophyllide A dehydrogenase